MIGYMYIFQAAQRGILPCTSLSTKTIGAPILTFRDIECGVTQEGKVAHITCTIVSLQQCKNFIS